MYKWFHRVGKRVHWEGRAKKTSIEFKEEKEMSRKVDYFPGACAFLVRHEYTRDERREYRTLCNLLRDGCTRAEAAYCEIRTGYFSATGDTGVSATLCATRASDVPLHDVSVRRLARWCVGARRKDVSTSDNRMEQHETLDGKLNFVYHESRISPRERRWTILCHGRRERLASTTGDRDYLHRAQRLICKSKKALEK